MECYVVVLNIAEELTYAYKGDFNLLLVLRDT